MAVYRRYRRDEVLHYRISTPWGKIMAVYRRYRRDEVLHYRISTLLGE